MSRPRITFLFAGAALAALVINGFLWLGAAQSPPTPYHAILHRACGEPVMMRAEDYNLLGGTRDDLDLARLDFCDPVRLVRDDGREELWFWLDVESIGQVYPYTSYGFAWNDIVTPFPADSREPRNAWWLPITSLSALGNDLGDRHGGGTACPLDEAQQRGVDLFFYREEGFQLPPGIHHSGWVCVTFETLTLPDVFTVTIQPQRARLTQWVDKVFMVRQRAGYDEPPVPVIAQEDWCDFARRTHPASVLGDGGCGG